MYVVDHRDRVVDLDDMPQCSIGAPIPMILADEHRLLLGYLMDSDEGWDGESVRLVNRETPDMGALVEFTGVLASYFGLPNDEAFAGHPLASRGLRPYSAARIENSSWLLELERRNAVHPYHQPKRFSSLTHYIFAFHDSTVECVAASLTSESQHGPMSLIAAEMYRRMLST